MYLKMLVIPVVVGLVSCSYEVIEHSRDGGRTWQPGSHPGPLTAVHDPATTAMQRCDSLGFYRGGDGHRLCVMRQIDRLGTVEPQPRRPAFENLPQSAPINILPNNPYPPLTGPRYVIPVVPQCIGCPTPGQ